MPLSAGDRLGPYVIAGTLGAGGMGEVYRARDPRLDRDVAIKIVRAAALADPDWRARFTQEAKAISALSHPNIVTVHDVGTEGNVAYMVMELVDGQTLERQIPANGMRLGEVLRTGAQIADACARAHAAGIIHRDLKPANIIVPPDGRVRVLDFGIAKLVAPVSAAGASSEATGTSPGLVLGTAAYMSPEQAEGRAVDARSDIFSLGAMLYEMTTGQRPFKGSTPMATMAAVLNQEPAPVGDARHDVPPELARLIMRCLRKDPARRVQSMADLRVALDELREEADSGRLTGAAPAVSRARHGRLVVPLAAVLAAALGLAGYFAWRAAHPTLPPETPQPVPLTAFAGAEGDPSLSPDGSQFAFRWSGEGERNDDIYVMLIGGVSPLRLTTDPRPDYGPRWSPDGRRLAFLRVVGEDRITLLLISPLGGPERTLGEFFSARTLSGFPMASVCWTPDSRYLFIAAAQQSGQGNGIIRITVDTGETLIVKPPPEGSRGFSSPEISPDGSTLAVAMTDSPDAVQLIGLSAAFEPRDTTVVRGPRNVFTVHWTPDGRDLLLTYYVATPQPLFRVPKSGGEPVPLAWVGPGAQGQLSTHGTRMVFERAVRDTNIVRVDLASVGPGRIPTLDRIAQSSFRDVAPHYSPDGKRLAFYSDRGGTVQIWTANADGSQPQQLTAMDPLATTGSPRWSPDGREIAFDSNTGGAYQIYVMPSGGGRPRALTSWKESSFGASWSPDGRWIYFSSNHNGNEIWRVTPTGGAPEPVTHLDALYPAFSRDGQWLFFVRGEASGGGIWRMPIAGGTPTRVVADHVYRYNYAVVEGGVYYVSAETGGNTGALRYADLATGAIRQILAIDKPLDLGLALSPDHRYLLFTQIDYTGQDLMLVENFR